MHYSRIMPVDNGRFFTSTAVFLSESSKFLFCLVVVLVVFIKKKKQEGISWTFKDILFEIFGGDAWKLSIPAGLYTVTHSSTTIFNPLTASE